jgi:acyl-CoA dehydrogenase
MDFQLSEDQETIVAAISSLVSEFGDDYWLSADKSGSFPEAFYQKMAQGGWLGIAMPSRYGGSNLGVMEAALMMHAVTLGGGGMSAASSVHINIFGPQPIVVFGNEEQQQEFLPPLISGQEKCCFGVTEPDAGLETGAISTFAEKTSSGYVVNGQKIWTSTAQHAKKILLLARTTPKDQCKRSSDGLSLFYTDLNRDYVEVQQIEKMGRSAVDSNMTFIDGLPVPKEHLIGEEGKGFKYLLHGLNAERILIAAEAIGLGQDALSRAAKYAAERKVFGRPIGQNQAIQHPLAENWMELEAAFLMCMKGAAIYDANGDSGLYANAAKYLGAEAGFKAATQAVMTLGGMGYAKEYHVERLLRESLIPRIAPVSAQLILCYIAEKALSLPKSY